MSVWWQALSHPIHGKNRGVLWDREWFAHFVGDLPWRQRLLGFVQQGVGESLFHLAEVVLRKGEGNGPSPFDSIRCLRVWADGHWSCRTWTWRCFRASILPTKFYFSRCRGRVLQGSCSGDWSVVMGLQWVEASRCKTHLALKRQFWIATSRVSIQQLIRIILVGSLSMTLQPLPRILRTTLQMLLLLRLLFLKKMKDASPLPQEPQCGDSYGWWRLLSAFSFWS